MTDLQSGIPNDGSPVGEYPNEARICGKGIPNGGSPVRGYPITDLSRGITKRGVDLQSAELTHFPTGRPRQVELGRWVWGWGWGGGARGGGGGRGEERGQD